MWPAPVRSNCTTWLSPRSPFSWPCAASQTDVAVLFPSPFGQYTAHSERRSMRRLQTVLFVSSAMVGRWPNYRCACARFGGAVVATPPRAARPPTPAEFHDSFGAHRQEGCGLQHGTVLSEKIPMTGRTHRSFSQTYANKVVADDTVNLPIGSIIVREDYDANKNRLSISVMYRVRDTTRTMVMVLIKIPGEWLGGTRARERPEISRRWQGNVVYRLPCTSALVRTTSSPTRFRRQVKPPSDRPAGDTRERTRRKAKAD